ncbi:MAG TPA: BON domain-containing protein, partial [Alphaproteobacteria bacterium]|nr:BON domain-containing protein [Alphaproteobacteria bacterium]
IRIGESATLASFAKDTWISGQLRTQITFDKYIQSINYSIETVRGAVYLMGVAQSQDELDRVIDIARKIGGVKEVISYVKFLGAPVEPGSGFQTGSAQGVAYEEQQGQLGQQGQGGSVPYDYNDGQNGQPVPLAGSMEGAASGSSTGYVAPSSVESEMLPP